MITCGLERYALQWNREEWSFYSFCLWFSVIYQKGGYFTRTCANDDLFTFFDMLLSAWRRARINCWMSWITLNEGEIVLVVQSKFSLFYYTIFQFLCVFVHMLTIQSKKINYIKFHCGCYFLKIIIAEKWASTLPFNYLSPFVLVVNGIYFANNHNYVFCHFFVRSSTGEAIFFRYCFSTWDIIVLFKSFSSL